jgi:putative ABC transport system permease protein
VLGHYLKAALGDLSRNWLQAAVSLGGLAVAFAAAILLGLYVRQELGFDRFLPDVGWLYRVSQVLTPPGGGVSVEADATRSDVAAEVRRSFPEVEAVTRLSPDAPVFRRGRIEGVEDGFLWADPNVFDLLRLPVVAGDLRTALARPDGLVLTRSLARKYFGEDAPLGKTLSVNLAPPPRLVRDPQLFAALNQAHAMTVTAVIEDLPWATHLRIDALGSGLAAYSGLSRPPSPYGQDTYTYLRLRPGASPQRLGQSLADLAVRRFPPLPMHDRMVLKLTAVRQIHLTPHRFMTTASMKPAGSPQAVTAAALIAGLIVAVAAANFVMLLMARAARRTTEIGVRKALGAGRGHLKLQFLGESVLQVALAMLVAAALVEIAAPTFGRLIGRDLGFHDLSDPAPALVIAVAALLIGLLAGAFPALVLSRLKPALALRGGVAAGGATGTHQALVVAQFAVVIALVVAASTIALQTRFVLGRALQLQTSDAVWIDEGCTPALRDPIAALPGVSKAACSSVMALESNAGAPVSAHRPGQPPGSFEIAPLDFGFFELYGVRPLAGRLFSRGRGRDVAPAGADGNPDMIVNDTAARRLGFRSAAEAVGQPVVWSRAAFPRPGPPILPPAPSRIVGVVPDFSLGSARMPIEPMIYYVEPAQNNLLNVRLTGRDVGGTLAAMDGIRRAVGGTRPLKITFVGRAVRELYADVTAEGALITVFAGVAALIASLGLFALASFAAERRVKEIGVRKAMGASAGSVARLLVAEFTAPVLVANLIAWPLAWWAMQRWLQGFAYRVDLPAWLFVSASALAVLIAWATVGTQVFAAARLRPATALRYE